MTNTKDIEKDLKMEDIELISTDRYLLDNIKKGVRVPRAIYNIKLNIDIPIEKFINKILSNMDTVDKDIPNILNSILTRLIIRTLIVNGLDLLKNPFNGTITGVGDANIMFLLLGLENKLKKFSLLTSVNLEEFENLDNYIELLTAIYEYMHDEVKKIDPNAFNVASYLDIYEEIEYIPVNALVMYKSLGNKYLLIMKF